MPFEITIFLFTVFVSFALGIRIGRGGAGMRYEHRIIALREALIEINAKTFDSRWTPGMLKIRMDLIGERCRKALKEDRE